MKKKYKIVIIGSGNVAEHLLRAFKNSINSEVIQIYSRNNAIGEELGNSFNIEFTNNAGNLKNADLYLISINDAAIAEVSASLPFSNKLVAHTSGATSIENIAKVNRQAVFYPLQSFTKGKEIDFTQIPICLEAKNNDDLEILTEIAKSISNTVKNISSEQRKYIHASAVFVNNFTNHLFSIGKTIAEQNNIDFNLLKPLIKETVQKLEYKTPKEAQTGPAVRGDKETMEKHLELIQDKTHKEIYKLISDSIFKTHN
jgi:predicted short-subunit dehydrogenase-like oxidoreductase (DUF2520 family)